MGGKSNLYRRGAVYYARIFVPKDLHDVVGKTELRPSLRTADFAEAKGRKAALLDQWTATFDDMRRRRELTPNEIAHAVWDHYSAGLAAHDEERLSKPTPAALEAARTNALSEAAEQRAHERGVGGVINALADYNMLAGKHEWSADRRRRRLVRLRSDLASGDRRLIEPVADDYIARRRLNIAKDGDKYRTLCDALMRAEIEQLERTAERDRGDYSGKPADPIVAEPTEPLDPLDNPNPAGDTIMALFDRYERENPNNIRPESFRQVRRDVQHFAAFVGPRVRGPEIAKAHVREWKDVLADWPVKATEAAVFKDLSIREIVEANKALAEPKPTLGRQTIRRYMSSLGGFCGWLLANDYLQANPVVGMLPKKAPPTIPRTSIDDDQLEAIFTSPLFGTAEGDQWRQLHKTGNFAVRDHRYWIPWIMLYSGARPGEIAQLNIGDVRQEHGVWIMHITTEGEGRKRTKTASSMRVVPIHSALIKLGLIDYRERLAGQGQSQLFPEIDIPEVGQIAAQFSREFNRYLAKIGVKDGKDLVTYSLRHTFIDRARRAGYFDDEIGIIVGHGRPTMTGRYGMEQEGTLRIRQEIVEAVQYPSVNMGVPR